jgi:hypothetical protein
MHSDEWRKFQNGAIHDKLIVNHSLDFVDPNTGIHTQNTEDMWMIAKGNKNNLVLSVIT